MPPSERIDNLVERIRTSDEIADADAERLLQFNDEVSLLQSEYSDHRREKLLRHTTIMAESVGGLDAALTEKQAAKRIVAWINRSYDNEETNRDYRVALRVFAKRVTGQDEPPESIDWVPSSTSKNYDPSPDPREMLHWEEHIEPMLEAARNHRDAAMVALQWDAGLRGGEFKDLSRGDLQDHDHGLQVTVDGKQGRRTVTLIPSVPYVRRWLDVHPGDEGDPLWSKLNQAAPISDRMVSKILDELAARAEVSRPVTLTNFRKSSAAFLASRGLNQAHIEDHHGWVRGSKTASRYVAVFADDAERELARVHGKDVSDEEPDPVGPRECPRCERETPRGKDLCMWCGQALEHGAVERLQRDESEIRKVLLRAAREDPSLLEEAETREEMLAKLEQSPEMLQAARDFIDEVDD